jgi:hypothetical protein
LLLEHDATKGAVVASLPKATHVHLACHVAASLAADNLVLPGRSRPRSP